MSFDKLSIPQSITTDTTLGTSEAAEFLGLPIGALVRSRKTGMLSRQPAPPSEMVGQGSTRRVLYRIADLEHWLADFSPKIPKRPTKPVDYASIMAFSSRNGGEPLLVSVRHRTFLRSLNLTNLLCVRWCHDRTADGRILLRAIVPMPDEDAGHCHLTDDTPAALSMSAEDLVLTIWKAVRSSPDEAITLAEAARSVPLPGQAVS